VPLKSVNQSHLFDGHFRLPFIYDMFTCTESQFYQYSTVQTLIYQFLWKCSQYTKCNAAKLRKKSTILSSQNFVLVVPRHCGQLTIKI